MSLWTIDLQCRRLRSAEPEDAVFLLRKWADFDFLIVALSRLRRAAELAQQVPEIKRQISPALKEFDSALPDLIKFRDVAEHVNEYAMDKGRKHPVRRQELEVSSLNGSTLEWLGHTLSADAALRASQKLFEAIKNASAAFTQRA